MSSPQVLVVGGGPAGSAAAHWMARDGIDVTLVEAKAFPREKTCGDGLTPRAILQLQEMGFDFTVPEFHRITGLRSYAGDDLMIEMPWPIPLSVMRSPKPCPAAVGRPACATVSNLPHRMHRRNQRCRRCVSVPPLPPPSLSLSLPSTCLPS